MVIATIYGFIRSTGNVVDDCIGKRIIDIYSLDSCGLCLSIFNHVLITQRELGQEFFDYRKNSTSMPTDTLSTDNVIKGNVPMESIFNKKPVLSIELTAPMLTMLPLELFGNLMIIWNGSKAGKYTLDPEIDKHIRIPS